MRNLLSAAVLALCLASFATAEKISVRENDKEIVVETPLLKAVIRKQGYVSGVARLTDKQTGLTDSGFGLDIVDWVMEDGSDEKYRDKLVDHMIYRFRNAHHGKRAKRCIEGPQICTKARKLSPKVIRGKNTDGTEFVAVIQSYKYPLAAPGKKAGSVWTQTLLFLPDRRYFLSSDRVQVVNSGNFFLRIDLPGHIKHKQGDTFSQIYLSYHGTLAAKQFFENFAPDEKFNYRRDQNKTPRHFIRAYRRRDAKTGQSGPWLAGITLDPSVVHEAWCHQRGYVCLIEEIGGRPVKAGESFGAAFAVGFFETKAEMEGAAQSHHGKNSISVSPTGWQLK